MDITEVHRDGHKTLKLETKTRPRPQLLRPYQPRRDGDETLVRLRRDQTRRVTSPDCDQDVKVHIGVDCSSAIIFFPFIPFEMLM